MIVTSAAAGPPLGLGRIRGSGDLLGVTSMSREVREFVASLHLVSCDARKFSSVSSGFEGVLFSKLMTLSLVSGAMRPYKGAMTL